MTGTSELSGTQVLDGHVAVVTGSAGGIGAGLVADLLRAGGRVAAVDIDADLATERLSELPPGLRQRALPLGADLATMAGATTVSSDVKDWAGAITVLVNNAGGGVIRPFADHDDQSIDQTLRRNLFTVLNMCRAVFPAMRDAGYGRIVNIGAESVRNGLWEHTVYNAAKGGVHGLTTGLAREGARHGVTVNTVAPSATETPAVTERRRGDPQRAALYEQMANLIPTGRFATVEEIAAVVTFLASPAASFVTGQVISVNGGSSML